MTNIFWVALKLCPPIVGCTLLATTGVFAAEPILPVCCSSASSVEEIQHCAGETSCGTGTQNLQSAGILATQGQEREGIEKKLVAQITQTKPKTHSLPASSLPSTPAVSQPLNLNSLSVLAAPRITPKKALMTIDASQINAGAEELSDPLAQLTSVSQLSDVQPTDWAFQALQNLVERYGAISGYPDGTFRGNRAMTRYEFAAGLNAALETINQLLATSEPERVRQEDLTTLQRLSADFSTELAQVRARIDTLQARGDELEANQFSTTTKLNGLISFNVAKANAGGDVRVERTDPNDIFSTAARGADGKPIVTRVEDDANLTVSQSIALFLTTSFTGKDSLFMTLQAGNGNTSANYYTSAGFYNTFGSPVLDLTPSATANDVVLSEAAYSFPVNDSLQVVVAPRVLWLRYFDTNAFTSGVGKGATGNNTFGSPLVQDPARGAGAFVLWRLNEQLNLNLGYVASPAAGSPSTGLFNGTRAFTAQVTYSPIRTINLRFLYDRSTIQPVDGQIRTRPIMGVADDGFGGALEDATADVFGFNFDWLATPRLGFFGRYTYANTHLEPATRGVESGEIKAQSVQLGVAFPDLGKRGALATLSYVVPFSVLDGRQFLVSGAGDRGVEYEVELTYYLPMTDNIAILPAFYFVGNANNFDDNPNIYVGTVQTQFSF
ncbi:iron uptake porin [Microcoleus sp. FACHB-672]|uniref:iron uptake porin n=1 Tax=Microcoleus sp. FACHB-672 TaxID=2692825 RepID=UPI001688C8E0|nr:iron uptake porin [Microcoleus sp. FACHB-672]MBD2043381.1 carbohydrate porin [Microcoleus sp. FACHB-672]